VIVEVEGAHHDEALNAVDDALRFSHKASGGLGTQAGSQPIWAPTGAP
jgi:hypothetical protein